MLGSRLGFRLPPYRGLKALKFSHSGSLSNKHGSSRRHLFRPRTVLKKGSHISFPCLWGGGSIPYFLKYQIHGVLSSMHNTGPCTQELGTWTPGACRGGFGLGRGDSV